jgi:hypothetical protein
MLMLVLANLLTVTTWFLLNLSDKPEDLPEQML